MLTINLRHRARCRRVMALAWELHRADPGRAFSDCLRGSWAFMGGMADFNRRHPLRAGRDGLIRLRSSIRGASNRLAGHQWERALDREVGRSIARVGW